MMAECQVDRMVVVPIVLRMLKRHIESATRKGGVSGAYLRAAGRVAAAVPSSPPPPGPVRPRPPPPGRPAAGVLLRRRAPRPRDRRPSSTALGIGVYQGYGLTEAAPTVSMNSPGHNRPGSVGRPLPGTDVRIAADGEILVHGPGVMLGYWDDEAATREAVDADGWLHTGDLGRLDDDGYLFVTGRSKSLIVLDSGKKVQPEEVETALARSELFAEVCVLGLAGDGGNGRTGEQVCAVVVPAAAADVGGGGRRRGAAAHRRPQRVQAPDGRAGARRRAAQDGQALAAPGRGGQAARRGGGAARR